MFRHNDGGVEIYFAEILWKFRRNEMVKKIYLKFAKTTRRNETKLSQSIV
jgi:hypothetical protein